MAIERYARVSRTHPNYDIEIYDGDRNIVGEVTTVLVESFNDSNDPLWDDAVCKLKIRAGGAGSVLSTTDKPRVFFQTDANGLLEIEAEDVATGSITGYMTVRPLTQYVGNRAWSTIDFSGG